MTKTKERHADSFILPTEEDLDPLERLSLMNLSYSRFNTFETCEAQYFFTYIAKEDRTFGPKATLGTVVHEVLEHSVGEGPLDLGEMHRLEREAHKEHDPDNIITGDLVMLGSEILYEFHTRHREDDEFIADDRVIAREKGFELIIGSARVRGYIDLVRKTEDGLIGAVDWKSGSWEVSDKDIPGNLQLGIYALAIAQENPHQEVFPAELYYLQSGKRKEHVFTWDDLRDVHDRVVELTTEIIDSGPKGFKCTDKGFVCKYLCDYGKTGVCGKGAYIVNNWGK